MVWRGDPWSRIAMTPETPPPIFDLYASTGAALTSVFGPAYSAHWSDCMEAVEVPASVTQWNGGQTLGAAFILWLANAGEAVDDIAVALSDGGGDLDEVTVYTRDHTLTIPAHAVSQWPDMAALLPADAMTALGNILTNAEIAAFVLDLRLREDVGGGSGLSIRYTVPGGREVVAAYGSPPSEGALLATERWLSGAALRSINVALNEMFRSSGQPDAPAPEPQAPEADESAAPAERFGAVGPETEPGQ